MIQFIRWISVDGQTVTVGQGLQATSVALTNSAELPFAVVAVQLGEDHRGFSRGVFGQIVTNNLGAVGLVNDTDEGVADLTEVLATIFSVMDRHGEGDLVDVDRHAAQIDLDSLVVTVAGAITVVAGMLNGTVRTLELVVEDEVCIAADFTGGV